MRIKALQSKGYRNLAGEVELCSPLAVLVGENNAGKSNLVDALRTVLEPEGGPRERCWLRLEDFTHDGHGGDPIEEELELGVVLSDLTPAEKGRLVTCLSPKTGADCARIRMRARLGADGRVLTEWLGGDSEHADVERHARSAVSFVYLHPLRDAAADLRPGRDNKLIGLINALAPRGDADRDAIVAAAQAANDALDAITAIMRARAAIANRLNSMTGRGRFTQQSDLAFHDPRFERVVGSLRAKIGELSALEMRENGLGYNNLLYMAVLLAAIADQPGDSEPTLRVLLVEEPEAHLHPQLQELLMRFLESQAVATTQVIVTSHSPTFASSARVERLTVLTKMPSGPPQARVPATFGLEEKQLSYLHRFLDVTKAALFFARGVVLVEGVAEQLLIPALAQRMGRPLAPSGVTVINVGGVAFPPFTALFGEERLTSKVAVVSDGDRQRDVESELDGAPTDLSPRAADLLETAGANLAVLLAERTLEWDLAAAGNVDVMLKALTAVKPRVGAALEKQLQGASREDAADAILDKVKDVKGRFAQELAAILDDDAVSFEIPKYLQDAIKWVADELPAAGLLPEPMER
ncbi:MAG TPA: AAA family ATPase [Solirubrobacteraceae bacterium]|nr:AAA family ATPase [Solirubrobacteraceae bacterium]